MKKALLFGTTALVAAGLFAPTAQAGEEGALVVGVHGYMNQYVGIQDNDPDTANHIDQWSNSEIWFTGKTQVVGGLEVGVNVQLEGNTSGDQIDESFLYLEGSFGRLLLGSENSAGYLMQYGAPNVGTPINSGDQGQFILNSGNGGRTPAASTFIEPAADNDGQKITYFTPRFEGFQLGVSLLPDIDTTGGDANTIDSNNTYDWGASAGANYVKDFESFNVAVAAGVYWAEAKDDRLDLAGDDLEDFFGYSFGLNVGAQGFTVGGSVAQVTSENTPAEGIAWDLGASYAMDRWSVSLTYFDNEMEDEEQDKWAVQGSVRYRLGTGVDAVGMVGYAQTEVNTVSGTSAVFEDNDGAYGGAGIEVKF